MSQGYQSALGIDTVQPVTRGFEFENCTIAKQGSIIDTSGIRGSRAHLAARTRRGNDTIAGTLELVPSGDDLTRLLPWIMGASAVGSLFSLAETISERYVQVDKVAQVCSYAGCYVNRATFTGATGEPLRLQLELLGKNETVADAGTFPSVAYSTAAPFLFSDTTLTLLGSAREVREWTVVIDQHLVASCYNATSATRITSRDRTVTLRCSLPFTASEVDLYNQDATGAAATLTLTGPQSTLTFQFAALQVPAQGPTIRGRGEVALQIEGVARRSGSTPEVAITLNTH